MINPTPLDFITGYTMEDTGGDNYFNNIPQQRKNLIDGYISMYWYISNSNKRIYIIKKAKKLTVGIIYID